MSYQTLQYHANCDESYYHLDIGYIKWNKDHQRYIPTTNRWFYYGNGYYPNYTTSKVGNMVTPKLEIKSTIFKLDTL